MVRKLFKKLEGCETVPANRIRWCILAMLFFQTCLSYIDRQTLSVLSPILREEFGMSNTSYSNILNCYFLAFTIMYIVGGRIMDRIGTYLGMALSVAFGATAGVLHSAVGSVGGLAVCRFLKATGEGPVAPGCAKTVAEWFPVKERGFATSVWLMGATIGATVAPVVVVWLYRHFGWRHAFLFTGLAGYLWVLLWVMLKRQWTAVAQPVSERQRQSIGHLFRHRAVWGVMLLRFFLDPVWFFYIFWLPEYLVNGKGLEMLTVGMLAWIPFLAADIGTLAGGSVVSWLQHRGWSINRSHKTVMILSAVMMMAGAAVPALSVTWQYIAAMCVSIIGMQMFGANNHTIPTQLFPSNIVGSVAGVAGCCAGVGSMLLTRFIGVSVDMTKSYTPAFCVVGLFYPLMLLVALGIVGNIKRATLKVEEDAHAAQA